MDGWLHSSAGRVFEAAAIVITVLTIIVASLFFGGLAVIIAMNTTYVDEARNTLIVAMV